jgi:arylsulfatase A-like enzyme
MGGKATRDFTNYRQPPITDADYVGPRAIIDNGFKLVIHEQKNGEVKRELFDLATDPAERRNILAQQPAQADKLSQKLHDWQRSVLKSLTGSDYSTQKEN